MLSELPRNHQKNPLIVFTNTVRIHFSGAPRSSSQHELNQYMTSHALACQQSETNMEKLNV